MKRVFANFRAKALKFDLFKPAPFIYLETIEYSQKQEFYSPEFELQAIEAMRERLQEFEAKLGVNFLDNFLPKHPTSNRGAK
jgi:hypothetical protein